MSDAQARILVVDDVPENVRLLEAVLQAHDYDVVTATDGQAALDLAQSAKPDLVLLDVMMPPPDGLAVCKRLREMEETAVLPVIMLTASEGSEKTTAIEAGADDFLSKPFNRDELLTRIRSLLRIKRYHDTIKSQAAELRDLNRTLEERVQDAARGARAAAAATSVPFSPARGRDRLLGRRFDPAKPPSAGRDVLRRPARLDDLRRHRRARGADARAGEFHGTIGGLVGRFDATVGFIEGDGVQLFFNDPIEVPDPALRAVRLGCALREEMAELTADWQKRGYDLDFGAGIALGYATCGEVGFEGRSDYAAIGAVTNLASRLADEATAGQILISQRLYAEVEDDVEVEPVGEFKLKGFQRPVAAFNVIAIPDHATELPSGSDRGHGDGAEPPQPLRAAEP